ncbi:MAG: PHP domain-containing protein [Steroidobacteraceae bacterium]
MFDLIDLHTHSLHSDGLLSPTALVALAATRGLKVLALTDHDSIAGCAEAHAACSAAGIGFVSGVELTAGWPMRGGGTIEIHVVGLGIDLEHPALVTHLSAQAQRRAMRVASIGAKLARERDFAGWDPATELLAQPMTPTRMHIARALVARGLARDPQHAFDRWLSRGKPGYTTSQWPEVAATVRLIGECRGHSALAHAHRYKLSHCALHELVAAFAAAGGNALEVSLPGMSQNETARIGALARSFGLAGSVGSDFHEPGLPWRPLGRFAKLPDQIAPLLARLSPR